ncbi:MAG TPA: BamA/TamA family outer membrane protein [Steroidobacteraceae bacterium]
MPWRATLGGAAIIAVWFAAAAWAADPQPYKVHLEGAVRKDIENTLSASSDLVSLRTSAPVSPAGLILRARGDTVRLKTVLESYGYYQSAVTVTIDGDALTSADVGDKLTALPKGKDATVVVSFVPGSQYVLGKVTIDGDLPAGVLSKFNLHTGQPAIAADVLAAGTRLLTALQDQGYAFAKVDTPFAEELPDAHQLDVSFHVVTGAVVHFGAISVTGLQRTRLSAVLSRLQLHTGDQYSAQALDKARSDLLAMGVFGSVDVRMAPTADAKGQVPITFRVSERKRHEVNPSAAYSSDLGGSGSVTWTDRNLFGGAEQLDLSASIINLNGSASNGLGYDTGAKLSIPEFERSQQTLQFSLTALKQDLIAYDQTAQTAAITLTRNLSKVWSASAGFSTTEETIIQPEAGETLEDGTLVVTGRTTFYYTLFALPLSLRYDSTDLNSPILDPTHGIRAALTLTPTLSLGPPNATFLLTQIRASTYLDLHDLFGTDPGRSVVAARGVWGYAQGASVFQLPPDQRFYAGGSGTIRGYAFESVGPLFQNNINTPVGGVAVDAFGLELRQRMGRNWGFAVFADSGRVGNTAMPFSGRYQSGVGGGPRYYTPIGPLRVDIAFPIDRQPYDSRLEVYIGLGQAF